MSSFYYLRFLFTDAFQCHFPRVGVPWVVRPSPSKNFMVTPLLSLGVSVPKPAQCGWKNRFTQDQLVYQGPHFTLQPACVEVIISRPKVTLQGIMTPDTRLIWPGGVWGICWLRSYQESYPALHRTTGNNIFLEFNDAATAVVIWCWRGKGIELELR